MMRIVSAACAAAAFLFVQPASAGIVIGGGFSVVFAPAGPGTTASGSSGSVLAGAGADDILQFTPGIDLSAEKVHTLATSNALLGDDDGDGDHFENALGGIDALEYRRFPDEVVPLPFGPLTVYDLVLSSRTAFGGAGDVADAAPFGAANGSLFRFVPSAAGQRVRIVLAESEILDALGQAPGPGVELDVDGYAQDDVGNVYLSFADDELVNGVLLGDGGVVLLPVGSLVYDANGDIQDAAAGSAVIVIDEAMADAFAQNSGVAGGGAVGDVRGLVLDPGAGTYLGADGQTHTNLLFTTENHGPVVFTTAMGGGFAVVNLLALGSATPNAADLGMASLAGVGPIALTDARDRALCADVADGEVDFGVGETLVQWALGNHSPSAMSVFLIGVSSAAPGFHAPGIPVLGKVAPEFLAIPLSPNLVFPVVADGNGVVVFTGTLTHSISTHVLIGQAYDVGTDQLGPPASIFFP